MHLDIFIGKIPPSCLHILLFPLNNIITFRHGTILHQTHICLFVYMSLFTFFFEVSLHPLRCYWMIRVCVLDRITETDNLHSLQRGSRVDVMTYLLFWYHDNWHVTQHNRTMNTHKIDTHVGQSLVPWSASSLSGCSFTSAGQPSCPCHGLWRWKCAADSEFSTCGGHLIAALSK